MKIMKKTIILSIILLIALTSCIHPYHGWVTNGTNTVLHIEVRNNKLFTFPVFHQATLQPGERTHYNNHAGWLTTIKAQNARFPLQQVETESSTGGNFTIMKNGNGDLIWEYK